MNLQLPDYQAERNSITYWERIAQKVSDLAERNGFVVTIERVPQEPLAMRNHTAKIEVRMKR